MGKRTFEGIVLEWSEAIHPQRHFRGITLQDINKLKGMLRKNKMLKNRALETMRLWIAEEEAQHR